MNPRLHGIWQALRAPRRARQAIFGGWAALTALSVLVALRGPGLALPAAIEVTRAGDELLVLVRNASDRPWGRLLLELDDAYFAERASLAPEETWRVPARELRARAAAPLELGDPWLAGTRGLAPEGRHAPPGLEVKALRLTQGDRVLTWRRPEE